MERCGRPGLEAEGIAQEIDLAHGGRRRKGQGNATAWELRVQPSFAAPREDAHAGRNHLGNRGELGTSESQFRSKFMG